MRLLLLVALVVLALPTVYGQAGEAVWLVGFGGEMMLPLLDGGELNARLGESVYLRILGRNGSVTITSPNGTVGSKNLVDGAAYLAANLDTTGAYTIETDDGRTIIIRVEEDEPSIPITVSTTILSNGLVEMTLQQPIRGYALFLSSGGIETYRPGEDVTIPLEGNVTGPFKVSLLRPGGPLTYRGRLAGTPYTLTIPLLVAEYTPRIADIEGRKIIVFKLPEWGKPGPAGLKPLHLGPLIVQVSAFTGMGYTMILEKTIIVVSPALDPDHLARTIHFNASEGIKDFEVIVGGDLGSVKHVTVKPPIARVKIFDTVHREYVRDARLDLPNSDYSTEDDWLLLSYYRSVTFSGYRESEVLEPVRNASIGVISNGFRAEPLEVSLRPGLMVELPVKLYRLYVDLLFPDGTPFEGEALIEVGSFRSTIVGGGYLKLPKGVYIIKSINPASFTSISLTLDADKHIRIYTVDDAVGLSLLRASAILLAGIASYQLYRIWLRRRIPPLGHIH
jgi:hypothetical protein